ncbi:MAG TPA: preprotein translocase subunit SecE [Gaiellaceae bacterium]|nr:preprotein translocase subunit SecE [Gaiellaceae bacterium]
MARQTRAQRRARREAREQQGGAPPRRPDVARPTANGGGGPERRPPAERAQAPHRERRIVGISFIRESWGELQKVEWPTQNQLVQGTVVVLVACIIVGVFLWLSDEVFRRLVQQVFL